MAFYPSSIPTAADLFDVDNRVESTVAVILAAGATSLTVVDGSRFPLTKGGLNLVSADGLTFELVLFSSRSGNVFTLTARGHGASTDSTFSVGARVFLANLAEHHEDMRDEVIAIETELGTLPKGSDATVKARLDRMQTEINTADADDVKIDKLPVTSTGQTAFTLAATPVVGSDVKAAVNGQLQDLGVDYSSSGTAFTWLDNDFTLETDDLLQAIYHQ